MLIFALNVSANKIINYPQEPQHTFVLIYFIMQIP